MTGYICVPKEVLDITPVSIVTYPFTVFIFFVYIEKNASCLRFRFKVDIVVRVGAVWTWKLDTQPLVYYISF